MPWPLVSRHALQPVIETLSTGRGVALLGAEGVGKTTLAAMAAGQLGQGDPVWVVGTLARSAVPFGAFGSLVNLDDVGKPAQMLARAAEAIRTQANSAPIIVDNARLLDPLSASLVYRLASDEAARPGASPVIVTVRSVLRVPKVVSALWGDGLLERLDLTPMDAGEAAAVVAAAGGGGDSSALYRLSGGSPLHLRMLLSTGGFEDTLPAAIDRYLNTLPTPVRTLLAYLCVYEPLAPTDLESLAGAGSVQQAVDAGAATVLAGAVYSGHPLFLERLAAALNKPEIQRLRAAVAARLAAAPSRTLADRLSRTQLTLQSDVAVDDNEVVDAADLALRLGDHSLAERLARGALERAESFPARLTLSTALGWQGRGREADSVLAGVDTGTLSEEELMAWALPRAANQFWMLSEPERATIFLQNIRGRVSAASSHSTLDALSATFAMNAGNIGRAVEMAGGVLARPDAQDLAVALAASVMALSSARMGRFDAARTAVDRALGSDYPRLLRFTVGLAETTVLLMAGDTEQAYRTARRLTNFAESAQPGRAIGEVLLAQVQLARGETAAAVELLTPAAAELSHTGYSWGPLALTYLTTAQGYLGEVAESGKTLAKAMSRHGTKSAMFAPELGVARAWRLSTIGDRYAAITAARDAARTAKRSGQLAVAVWAWHEATRLGDRRAAAALSQIAGSVPCVFTDLALAHATALAAGDAEDLRTAARALAAAGFGGASADAARQADEAGG